MNSEPSSTQPRGVEHAHVIDIVAHDANTGEVALIMLEPRPWDGSELQMFQLQEKLNAYLSFALDGEMAAAYPAFAQRPLGVRIDCATPPDPRTLHLLGHVRRQLQFQDIELEVRVSQPGDPAPPTASAHACGGGCQCN
jgi:hypothetical protein